MKKIALALLISSATHAFCDAPSFPSAPVSVSVEARFNDEFKFDTNPTPSVSSEAAPPFSDEKPVVLKKFVVRPLSQFGLLEISFLQQEQAFRDKAFTNNGGGTIFETKWGKAKVEYKFKYNPSRNLMDIFNLSW